MLLIASTGSNVSGLGLFRSGQVNLTSKYSLILPQNKSLANFFKHLILGYRNYWLGAKFLFRHNLYWFALFPIALFIGIYILGFWFEAIEGGIAADLKKNANEIQTINALIWVTLKMLFFDSLYIVFTKFTLYIVVILLAPVLAILSEKIEEKLTGNKYPFNYRQLLHDIRRGIRIALRNIFWEYFLIVIVLGIGSFLGGAARGLFIFAIPICIGFYFYGFSFIDYVNERRRLNLEQSIYFVGQHRGLAIAIGSIYSVFFLSYFYVFRQFDVLSVDTPTQIFWGFILLITFILAATAPILAIASATLSVHALVDLRKNTHAWKEEENTPTDGPQNQDPDLPPKTSAE